MQRVEFEIVKTQGEARAGVMRLARGAVETPAFMPVGTRGAVKTIAAEDLRALDFSLILGNAFHLWLRPGLETIRAAGGLRAFAAWPGLILTDSGGFQVFSLRKTSAVREEGVAFRAPHSGKSCFLSPETAVEIQRVLGVDIAMAFDECAPQPADEKTARAAMERTLRWAARSLAARGDSETALFGIAQGGVDSSLRAESIAKTTALGFDGYALGGLSVGESKEQTEATTRHAAALLPRARPRYSMGVGTPGDIAFGALCGIDLFDCVLPTRNARNGHLFTSGGILRIKNAKRRDDFRAPDPACECPLCRRHSRAYLRHLFAVGEPLAARLATLHNLAYYRRTMRRLREAIIKGDLEKTAQEIRAADNRAAD